MSLVTKRVTISRIEAESVVQASSKVIQDVQMGSLSGLTFDWNIHRQSAW